MQDVEEKMKKRRGGGGGGRVGGWKGWHGKRLRWQIGKALAMKVKRQARTHTHTYIQEDNYTP